MKKIQAFEYTAGWGSIKDTIEKVNNRIEDLEESGKEVEVIVTGTGKGVIYTLIWND